MHRKAISCVASLCALMTGACASTPDVIARHYLPQGSLALRAVRTVGCSTQKDKKKRLHLATTVTSTASYSRNPDDWDTVTLSRLSEVGSNTDITFTYYDDGRLKGINATTEGVGEQIIASAIKIAAMVVGLPGPGLAADETRACALIAEQTTDKAPVTVTYGLSERFLKDTYAGGKGRDVVMMPEPGDPSFTRILVPELPLLCAAFGPPQHIAPVMAPATAAATEDATHVRLRQPAHVAVVVTQESEADFATRRRAMADRHDGQNPCGGNAEVVWRGSMEVPQLGDSYEIPLPEAVLFGKNTFQLALAESGAITSIGYGTGSGGPSLLNSVSTAVGALQPDTDAEKAAATQAEANLIYQQQRLVRCQMDASTCTPE